MASLTLSSATVETPRRRSPWARLGLAGFLFFLIKGLLWLILPAALWLGS
ncbi:MAG: hypothetical protein K8H90_01115 [Thermoanaerobaculia bacterium]|nr:hypothetical protein [Thermoanaerobaculia bacterium]